MILTPEPQRIAQIDHLPYRRSSIRVPRQGLVERPRLMRVFEAHDSDRLIMLNAPAGYGKTALLQQWANSRAGHDVVAWLALGPRDSDPMVLATHLNAALEHHGVAIEEPGAGMAGSLRYYSWQAVLERIGESFAASDRRCRIFIDDAHKIGSSEAINALTMLIEDAPPALQFVIAARGEIGLPLGRIRAHHEMLELRAEELCFLESETQSFLNSRAPTSIAPEQVRLLQDRSEGWIVGIKLFSMALKLDPENQHILESFSGERRQIADFFIEDVFSRQPEDLQDFLLRSSVLDRFCPALCDAALQIEGSMELIERCEAAGLFLQALDQTRSWYRYHHLFTEFLQRQLQDRMSGEAVEIHRRAANWFSAAGRNVEAFDCAIKGQDPLSAASILDENCEAMFAAGLQPTIQAMASVLPAHIQALYPRLMLVLAWRLTAQWRLSEARDHVAVAQRRVDEMFSSNSADLKTASWLRFAATHRETQILHASYLLERLESQCISALDGPYEFDKNPFLMGSFHNSLQYAQREQFKLSKIVRLDALAREQVARTGVEHGMVFIAGTTGPSLLLMGRTDRAREVFATGLQLAQRIAGRDDPLGAVVATSLAALHYECNEIDEARALIDRHLPLMTSAGFVDQLLNGWITKVRLELLDGRIDAGLEVLETAWEFASRYDLERLRGGISAEHLRILLKAGRPDDAARFARRRGISNHRTANPVREQGKYSALASDIALANCRLMAADDRFGEALSLARQWRSFVTAAQAVHTAVTWDIMIAELLLLSGDRLTAHRALQQAIAKAAPARFMRRFLDEGEPVAGMLRQMAQTEFEVSGSIDPFLSELVGLLGPIEQAQHCEEEEDDDLAICGRITGREIEILTLAGSGMLNRQIGENLGLTEGTVKWYLQQVFDKVGIRNRKQAVARVRRLGLIP